MASPGTFTGSTFTELVTTTFRKHRGPIKDNLSNRNALLKYMNKRGNTKQIDGGLSIVQPLDYAANGTYQRFSDWDLLDVSASEVISAAEYQWRQIAINVVASGREVRINSGESRIADLVASRMKNAIRTFNNNFSNDLYSDGTVTNQINGLASIVPDTNTVGTVGGINAATFSFWQNALMDASVASVTTSATTIENGLMLPLWLKTDRGPDDQTDLIVMDSNYYTFFESSQVSLKRYNDVSTGSAGFVTLKYKNADVVYDGNSGILANHAFFLNTNYLQLVTHQDCDLEVMDDKGPYNQDGSVTPILWMGNLTCSNRKLQGVIIE
jgi:hypothetical protein